MEYSNQTYDGHYPWVDIAEEAYQNFIHFRKYQTGLKAQKLVLSDDALESELKLNRLLMTFLIYIGCIFCCKAFPDGVSREKFTDRYHSQEVISYKKSSLNGDMLRIITALQRNFSSTYGYFTKSKLISYLGDSDSEFKCLSVVKITDTGLLDNFGSEVIYNRLSNNIVFLCARKRDRNGNAQDDLVFGFQLIDGSSASVIEADEPVCQRGIKKRL